MAFFFYQEVLLVIIALWRGREGIPTLRLVATRVTPSDARHQSRCDTWVQDVHIRVPALQGNGNQPICCVSASDSPVGSALSMGSQRADYYCANLKPGCDSIGSLDLTGLTISNHVMPITSRRLTDQIYVFVRYSITPPMEIGMTISLNATGVQEATRQRWESQVIKR
jgi:hypothetical protein